MKLITIKLICRVCLYCDLEYENEFVEKKIFIHINTTNPALLEDSDERKKINEEGWEVSYDGMEINL